MLGIGQVVIGNWCAIGEELAMITSNHDMRFANLHIPLSRHLGVDPHAVPGRIEIGSAVWIGHRVTILAGATVGHGAIIGAGSVVRGEIPPFAVVAGVPARPIRRRFPDAACDELLDIAWWDWPTDQVERNRAFFEIDLTLATVEEIRTVVRP